MEVEARKDRREQVASCNMKTSLGKMQVGWNWRSEGACLKPILVLLLAQLPSTSWIVPFQKDALQVNCTKYIGRFWFD